MIGEQQGGSGAYNLTGGTLEDNLVVGKFGTGAFNNTGGVHTVQRHLILGRTLTRQGHVHARAEAATQARDTGAGSSSARGRQTSVDAWHVQLQHR